MKKPRRLTLDDLHENPTNPRTPWRRDQIGPFLDSLRKFGDLGGIIRNTSTGHLVGGHKRVEAFRTSKVVEISKTDQKEDRQGTVAHGFVIVDGMRFAYREVRWSQDIETAANLAANQWGAEWEWQGVSEALKGIQDSDLLGLTGFPDHELQNLLGGEWVPPARGTMPGEEPGTHVITLTEDQYSTLQQVRTVFPETIDPTVVPDADLIHRMCRVFLGTGFRFPLPPLE